MKQYFLVFFSKEQEIVVIAQWFDFYLKHSLYILLCPERLCFSYKKVGQRARKSGSISLEKSSAAAHGLQPLFCLGVMWQQLQKKL